MYSLQQESTPWLWHNIDLHNTPVESWRSAVISRGVLELVGKGIQSVFQVSWQTELPAIHFEAITGVANELQEITHKSVQNRVRNGFDKCMLETALHRLSTIELSQN